MKKLLLSLVAIFAMGNVDARMGCHTGRCHEKKHCEKPVVTEACKPKCVKRCVVEKCVAPIRHEEKIVTYSCPTDCAEEGADFVPRSEDVTHKYKRQKRS